MQLKVIVIKTNFKDQSEEIKFFKEIKPLLFSKLIYQIKALNIESKRPKKTGITQKIFTKKTRKCRKNKTKHRS